MIKTEILYLCNSIAFFFALRTDWCDMKQMICVTPSQEDIYYDHKRALIIGYAPCEMHSIKGGMTNCQAEMKKAVECGYWNMFRFNPAAKAEGKNPFTIDSKAPAGGYQEFLMNEARYSALTRSFPERATELFAQSEEAAKARYEKLQRLEKMYEV